MVSTGTILMNKPKAFFVVSQWNNDISWVEEYTDDYVIYDKSNTLPEGEKIVKLKNVGYNIYDICHFIVNHYDNLPDVIAFLEGNPFDHCNRTKFDKIIFNETFTPIESYEHILDSAVNKKGLDGGYMEVNNSWYIPAHINTHGKEVNKHLHTYNQFLRKVFKNPVYPDWIRFSPGGEYIVPKENILFYSKKFYQKLMSYVDYHQIPSEGHIIERALYTIFTNQFQEKGQMIGLLDDVLYWFIDSGKEIYGNVLHWFIDFGKKIYREFLPDSLVRIIRRIRNGISR